MRITTAILLASVTLAACVTTDGRESIDGTRTPTEKATAIPASLHPFGDGYPRTGDPCRRLGEGPSTGDWLDHTADLVGCPDARAAAALGGGTVAEVDGVIVVSLPRESGRPIEERPDALVPGTGHHATTRVACSVDGGRTMHDCGAGVIRAQSPGEATLVEITRPDGTTRVVFFEGLEPIGADGSAAYTPKTSREDGGSQVVFGPERYVVPDALIEGG